jgi:hypothetical protein
VAAEQGADLRREGGIDQVASEKLGISVDELA